MAAKARVLALAVLFVAVLVILAPSTTASASGAVHCVRPGETLYRIGTYYGVSAHSLALYNGLANPNYIRAGWCLRIPPRAAPYACGWHPCPPRTVPPYPCGWQPCPPKVPVRVAPPCVPPGCGGMPSCGPLFGGWYTVRAGDTLFHIGRCFGVSPWAIANANRLANPHCIYVGQRLYVPGY